MKTIQTMKAMVIAATLICGVSVNAQAQSNDSYETKNEVAVTIGAGSNSQIFSAFSDLFTVMGTALISSVVTGGIYTGTTTYDNETNIPPISVEYFHRLNNTVSIGAIGGFCGSFSDMFCTFQKNQGDGNYKIESKEKVGTSKKYFVTLMPAAKFDWLRKKNFGVYSKVALGVTYMYEKEKQDNKDGEKVLNSESRFMANFQASLLGIEAGLEKVRGFAELGAGEQGILVAGIRCKF
jgi:hypothetical protein